MRLSFLSSAITFYDDYIDFLVSQHRAEDALEAAELSRARTLEDSLSSKVEAGASPTRAVRPQRIAEKLKATLLFYCIGHNHSYLWAITPRSTAYFELPKASEIEPVVKSYWQTLTDMRDAQDSGRAQGEKLYAMLVEPAKRLIPLGSRVIVLPAESLYGLNFETLVVPQPQPHYWIEDVTPDHRQLAYALGAFRNATGDERERSAPGGEHGAAKRGFCSAPASPSGNAAN